MHHRCIAICGLPFVHIPRPPKITESFESVRLCGPFDRWVSQQRLRDLDAVFRTKQHVPPKRCKASSSSSSRQQRLPFRRRRQILSNSFVTLYDLYISLCSRGFLCLAWLDTWKAEDAMMLGPESCELLTLGLLGLIRLIPVH